MDIPVFIRIGKEVIMELVMIRHGQADEQRDGQPDASRRLTAEGRQKLAESLAGYRRCIKVDDGLVIWASPLIRAVQTAEIIAESLQIGKIRQVASIGTGDFESFATDLRDAADASCLMIVGHEPHLGLWSQLICGIWLPFRKGAAAGFNLTALTPVSGELLWFAQPRILRRMGC